MPISREQLLEKQATLSKLTDSEINELSEHGITVNDLFYLQEMEYWMFNPEDEYFDEEIFDYNKQYTEYLVSDSTTLRHLASIDEETLKTLGILHASHNLRSSAGLASFREGVLANYEYIKDHEEYAEQISELGISNGVLNFLKVSNVRLMNPGEKYFDEQDIDYFASFEEYIMNSDFNLDSIIQYGNEKLEEHGITEIVERLRLKREVLNLSDDLESFPDYGSQQSELGLNMRDLHALQTANYISKYPDSHGLDSEFTDWADKIKTSPYYRDSAIGNVLNKLSDKQLADNGLDVMAKKYQAEEKRYLNKIKINMDLILKSPEIGEKESKYGLSKKELVSLRLLQYVSKESDPTGEKAKALPDSYKEFLAKFVEESLGNMKLNKKLSNILSPKPKSVSKWSKFKNFFGKLFGSKSLTKKQMPKGTLSNDYYDQMADNEQYDLSSTLSKLSSFTYKTRRAKQYDKIADKFLKNEALGEVQEQDKLRLKEFGILSDISKAYEFVPEAIYGNSDKLNSMVTKAKKIQPTLTKIRKNFSKNIAKKHSIIASVNMKKHAAIRGKGMTFMAKLRRFVTKADHTSMLYRKGESEALTESHLNLGLEQNEYSFGTYMYSDLYRINLAKLISKANKEILKEKLGDKWLEKVNNKFSVIERKIHDNAVARYTRITVPTAIGFQKRGIKSLFYAIRNKMFSKTNFKDIHKKMMNDEYTYTDENPKNVTMLCSGFTAHATIASFIELNKVLKEDFKKDYNIDLADEMVKVPISRRANLDVMTPEVLINQLKSFKCLETVEVSPEISKHIKFSK